MDSDLMLDDVMEAYLDALIGYLISKRCDREWVKGNRGWLERLVASAKRTQAGIRTGGGMLELYRTAEENQELKSMLYEACSQVLDRYRGEACCAA
jgi:SH3-like domain-containing protein